MKQRSEQEAEAWGIVLHRLNTLKEVCLLLRKSRSVVEDLARRNEIRGAKIGNEWRFNGRDLLEFIRRRMNAG